MLFVRLLLIPFAAIYGLIVSIRNLFYKAGIFGSTTFNIPIICVGNLSYGGTGKTPHIEYLIRLLEENFNIAVLSRGYRRKTKGYIFADDTATASSIGDEPYQIKEKFKNIAVGVCENRVIGVPELLSDAPHTQVILMDDGLQHRALKAGLNILLTDYSRLFTRDFIAPSGTLREFRPAYKRSEIIIVTKCPENLSKDEQQKIILEIAPLPSQKVFFTFQSYDEPIGLYNQNTLADKQADVLVFAGIANTYSLEAHLKTIYRSVTAVRFADHKEYTEIVLNAIIQKFEQMDSKNKIIITTEKDAVKLRNNEFAGLLTNIPIYYQPLKIEFFSEFRSAFNNQIINYVTQTN